MEALRRSLASGSFDRHGRRPRVRWEIRPDQRPMSRLSGVTHRLIEELSAADPSLAQWKVQSAGRAAEFWSLRTGARPVCVGKIDEAQVLSNVSGVEGILTVAQVQEAWRGIASS